MRLCRKVPDPESSPSSPIRPNLNVDKVLSKKIDEESSSCVGVISTCRNKPNQRMNSVGRTLKEAKAINPDINLQSFVNTKEPVIKKMIGRRHPDIESKFRGKRFTIDVKMLGLENELMRPLLLNNSNAASGSKASFRHDTSFDLNYGKNIS